jgi:hypothetical protein
MTFYENGAGATLREAAAVFRTGKSKLIADYPEKGRVRLGSMLWVVPLTVSSMGCPHCSSPVGARG